MSIASATPTSEQVVNVLQQPATYPDDTSCVETVETHISWIFLTDRYAYKLKKPVQFGFLDFSTTAARQHACAEEVRLNRRLARNVYLATLPVTFDEHRGLELNGGGCAVDYVVKMRRLPSHRALDLLIRHRELRPAEIESMSRDLVAFYTHLPPMVLQPQAHHRHLVDHCRANLTDLLRYTGGSDAVPIRRTYSAQQRFLTLKQQLFYDRVCDGRIVDGHGDLRAEHIYLESPLAVIDCVEFSPELRQVDVVDELCFLAMDCERLGNGAVGRDLLQAYQAGSGDHPPEELLSFYKCYRATVRAKVAALRAHQVGSAGKPFLRLAHQYLAWADHYADALGPPALVLVGGLMGSGKSTLADAIADAIGADVLHTDQIRRAQLGHSSSPATYGTGNYQQPQRMRVYEEMFARADHVLAEGRSVVLDGTFLTNALRRRALRCGEQHRVVSLFVECECPRKVALARIASRAESRNSDSEARPELYERQLAEREPFDAELPLVRIDSKTSVNEELQSVFAAPIWADALLGR